MTTGEEEKDEEEGGGGRWVGVEVVEETRL